MKKSIFLGSVIAGFLGLVGISVFAAEMSMDAKTVEVGNKICPISGEKIVMGKEGKVEHNGKTYNLCCQMCEKDFKKDPQKYIDGLNKDEMDESK